MARFTRSVIALAASGLVLASGAGTLVAPQVQATPATLPGVWEPIGTGANQPARMMANSGDRIYIAGDFTTFDGLAVPSHIVSQNVGADSWTAVPALLDSMSNPTIPMAIASNYYYSSLFVVGSFASANGVANSSLVAKWDGATWTGFGDASDQLIGGYPYDIFVNGLGDVYITGSFTGTVGGTSLNGVAKWDGTDWQPLGTGLNAGGVGRAIAGDGSGNIWLAGEFTTAGGVSANELAIYDSLYGWRAYGAGIGGRNNPVYNLAEVPTTGPNALVALSGDFTSIDNNVVNGIAILDAYGTVTPLGSGIDTSAGVVRDVYATADNHVYVAGSFAAVKDGGGNDVTNTGGFAMWNGTQWLGTSPSLSGGAASAVTVPGDDVAYVGGYFTGTSSSAGSLSRIAAFHQPPSLTSVSVSSGVAGTMVRLDGFSLGTALMPSTVTFGGAAVTDFYWGNSYSFNVTAPPHAAGTVDVTVTTAYGTSTLPDAFTYTSSPASAPQNLRQTAKAKGSMTFAWNAPASNGGDTIQGYRVEYKKRNASTWTVWATSTTARTATLRNLPDGTRYDVRVAAVTSSLGAYATLRATSPGLPAEPTRVTVTVKGAKVTGTWAPVVAPAGSTIKKYQFACRRGNVATKALAPANTRTISMTVGRGIWSCRVYAFTEAGHGPGSTPKSVTVR